MLLAIQSGQFSPLRFLVGKNLESETNLDTKVHWGAHEFVFKRNFYDHFLERIYNFQVSGLNKGFYTTTNLLKLWNRSEQNVKGSWKAAVKQIKLSLIIKTFQCRKLFEIEEVESIVLTNNQILVKVTSDLSLYAHKLCTYNFHL